MTKWFIAISIIILGVLAAKLITTTQITLQLVLLFTFAFVIISFRNPFYGIVILVFSMLLSPGVTIASLPGRDIKLRIDDFLLVMLFIVWLVNMAVRKELPLIKKTPLNIPITVFTLVCVVATGRGIMLGLVNPVKSSFYLLKYLEYFFLYFMGVNIITQKDQINKTLIAALITFVIVVLFGYTLMGKGVRLYSPFDFNPETGSGECATLGGYLIIASALILSFFSFAATATRSLALLGLFLFQLPIFIYTFSRASYFAFVPMYLSMIFLVKRRRFFLAMMLIGGFLLTPVLFPKMSGDVIARLGDAFENVEARNPAGGLGFRIKPYSSAALRLESWTKAVTEWIPAQPLLGHGASGVGVVDAQFPLTAGETGLIGLLSLLWLIYAVGRASLAIYKESADTLEKPLALGLLVALVGLFFQSFAVNTFIIVRIMEPFWLLTAMVIGFHYSSKEQRIQDQNEQNVQ
jgi:O-antigen ligase